MSAMNKEHEYGGYKFNIKVELNHRVEKRIDGKREHKITVNDMGATNYYQTHLAESHNLEEIITYMMEDAEKWVYNRTNCDKTQEQLLLESMGFK